MYTNLDNNAIIAIIVVAMLGLFFYDRTMVEGMCGYKVPATYNLNYKDEDYITRGLKYDNNEPRNPLLGYCQFSKQFMPMDQVKLEIEKQRYNSPGCYIPSDKYCDGIPYEKAPLLIAKSKLHDLYHQHNHAIKWSPHTHIGKARGRMNWEQTQ